MEAKEVMERAKKELRSLTNLEVSSVVGASRVEGDGWEVTIELIERKAIPDSADLLGLYEVHLDAEDGHMISFERRRLRHRMDVEQSSE